VTACYSNLDFKRFIRVWQESLHQRACNRVFLSRQWIPLFMDTAIVKPPELADGTEQSGWRRVSQWLMNAA